MAHKYSLEITTQCELSKEEQVDLAKRLGDVFECGEFGVYWRTYLVNRGEEREERHFGLDEIQWTKFIEWRDKQSKVCHRAGGDAEFSSFEFIFQTSNVGTAVKVRNVYTKEELDLTDWGSF